MDFTKRVQKYVNVEDHETPTFYGADIVEIKYDGWWARVVVRDGHAKIFSRQGQLKAEQEVKAADGVYIGEYLVGTQRAVQGADGASGVVKVFDCISIGDKDIYRIPLTDRKMLAEKSIRDCSFLEMTPHFPADNSEALWDEHVENGDAEGLVWKNSKQEYIGSTVWRRKQVFTMDYVVMEVNEGAGRRKGMVGNLLCGLYEDGKLVAKVRVGGGFSDAEGKYIFENFEKFRGRVLEVKGWHIFSSGSMRHPNAVRGADGQIRWRSDKRPEDCVWPCHSSHAVQS